MKAYTMGITKDEFVTEMKRHQALDAFIRGRYDNEGAGDSYFKGCAVGCSLESVARLKNITLSHENHKEFETHLGIPMWLAFLEDKIFENCSQARAKTWPVEFAEAINEGADLNKIKIPFLIFIVETARACSRNEKVLAVIDGVLVELKKDVLDLPKLDKARAAASASASASASYASAASYAAASASYASYAAASYASASAAFYASASASAPAVETFDKFADKLLELLKECGE